MAVRKDVTVPSSICILAVPLFVTLANLLY
jgi:hypothetical protein